jgi:hypothetical protein
MINRKIQAKNEGENCVSGKIFGSLDENCLPSSNYIRNTQPLTQKKVR